MAIYTSPISREFGVRLNTGTPEVPRSRFVSLGKMTTTTVIQAQAAIDVCKLLAANLEPPVMRYERVTRDELSER